jgi:ATP-dependent DNA helicase RecQ
MSNPLLTLSSPPSVELSDDQLAEVDWDAVERQAKELCSPAASSPTALSKILSGDSGNGIKSTIFDDNDLIECANKYLAICEFRPGQKDVILSTLQGRDTLVLWATGQGKSLCYQLPALLTQKTVLVVSPLISLMTDQVVQINNKIGFDETGRLPACVLGSSQTDPMVERDALNGDYRLVYVTPEKLAAGFAHALKPLYNRGGLVLCAVDEAHCCSEWGHDFRPTFRHIGPLLREAMPALPICALTATAVPRVKEDISSSLLLRDPSVHMSSLDRTNLRVSVMRKKSFDADMRNICSVILRSGNTHGSVVRKSAIVYVISKNDADRLAETLLRMLPPDPSGGTVVRSYHGDMSAPARDLAHRAFLTGATKVVVATIAFGMGIDKPDISTIIHYGPPQTMEGYVQHIGRAGRDGMEAQCVMLFSDDDFVKYESDFYQRDKPEEARRAVNASAAALKRFSHDTVKCRRVAILEYFMQTAAYSHCGTCDNCIAVTTHKEDHQRDFTDVALVIFSTLQRHFPNGASLTKLCPLILDAMKVWVVRT